MDEYQPHCWVVLKIPEPNACYKVLAGWRGGYLDGDSWQINSGITQAVLVGDYWEFTGRSGSLYRCHVQGYGMQGMYLIGLQEQCINKGAELMPYQNWNELEYLND